MQDRIVYLCKVEKRRLVEDHERDHMTSWKRAGAVLDRILGCRVQVRAFVRFGKDHGQDQLGVDEIRQVLSRLRL